MPKILQPSLLLLSGVVALATVSCNRNPSFNSSSIESMPAESAQVAASSSSPPIAAPSSAATPTVPQTDMFQQAVNEAMSAANLSQSAQSRDDWQLVARRWQQAINSLEDVPANHPNYSRVQSKISEYRRNLEIAQQQGNRPAPQNEQPNVVIVQASPSRSTIAAAPAAGIAQPAPAASPTLGVFQAPIVRREGGTPVISVMFNGNQSFEMIVDTGASGTLITQQMAEQLRVQPVGQAQVNTASARSVAFPLGYVRTIQVGDAIANNVLVAVAGPDLSTGLLGHDFFGDYDVTIRQDMVEFRERQ